MPAAAAQATRNGKLSAGAAQRLKAATAAWRVNVGPLASRASDGNFSRAAVNFELRHCQLIGEKRREYWRCFESKKGDLRAALHNAR